MAGKTQIGCHLTPADGADLESYAEALELSRARLCALLVQRELRMKRLGTLKRRFRGSEAKDGNPRVTARIADTQIKTDFNLHVSTAGLGSDDAAAVLFRAELADRWLAKALGK